MTPFFNVFIHNSITWCVTEINGKFLKICWFLLLLLNALYIELKIMCPYMLTNGHYLR